MNDRMSHEEFQNYVAFLGGLLRLGPAQREAVEDELRAHMEERFAALTARGIGPDRAISMALAEFGDAAALAAQFSAVAKLRRRRWMMRFTMTVTVAAVALVFFALSVWPDGSGRFVDTTAQAQQSEKSEQVEKAPPVETGKSDPNSQTMAKLDAPIDAEFADTPLKDVLSFLADKAAVQFHFDVRSLSDIGVSTDVPVTFSLKGVPAEMVLRLVLKPLGLTYILDNGVVIVTTEEEAGSESHLEARVYPIDDLVRMPAAPERAAPAPTFRKEDSGNSPKITPSGLSFDNVDTNTDPIAPIIEPTSWDDVGRPGSIAPHRGDMVLAQMGGGNRRPAGPRDDVDRIMDLIKSTIEPTTWDEVGGQGSIAPYRGTLVISQIWRVHKKVEKLLNDLREAINPDFPVRPTGEPTAPQLFKDLSGK